MACLSFFVQNSLHCRVRLHTTPNNFKSTFCFRRKNKAGGAVSMSHRGVVRVSQRKSLFCFKTLPDPSWRAGQEPTRPASGTAPSSRLFLFGPQCPRAGPAREPRTGRAGQAGPLRALLAGAGGANGGYSKFTSMKSLSINLSNSESPLRQFGSSHASLALLTRVDEPPMLSRQILYATPDGFIYIYLRIPRLWICVADDHIPLGK